MLQSLYEKITLLGVIFIIAGGFSNGVTITAAGSASPVSASTSNQDEQATMVQQKSPSYRWAMLRPYPFSTSSSYSPSTISVSSSPIPSNEELLLNSIRDRLWMIQPNIQRNAGYTSRKRSCIINAGLSNNCDFRDFVVASNARRIWESQASPGKRSSSPTKATKFHLALSSNWPSLSSSAFQPIPSSWSLDIPSTQIDNDEDASKSNNLLQLRPQSSSNGVSSSGPHWSSLVKRMECFSGLPGGDCENSFLGGESLGQDFLRPGGRNPGRR